MNRDHHGALPQPQRRDGSTEQIGASRPSLDHRDVQIGSPVADHQSRKAPAGSKIDHCPRPGWDQLDEPIRVTDRLDQRLLTDRPALLDDGQRGDELGVIRHFPA